MHFLNHRSITMTLWAKSMTNLSEWANRFNANQYLYELEKGLYMMKEKQGNGIPCYSWSSPVYYVWARDKMILATMNYHEAYRRWKDEFRSDTEE